MFKASTVNKYSMFVTSFSVVAMILSLLSFIDNLDAYLNPVVSDKEKFTYNIVTSEVFQDSLMLKTRNNYFADMKEDNFEEEKVFLYKIYDKEINDDRPRYALQTLVYIVLFGFVFNMHIRLVRDSGGWKV